MHRWVMPLGQITFCVSCNWSRREDTDPVQGHLYQWGRGEKIRHFIAIYLNHSSTRLIHHSAITLIKHLTLLFYYASLGYLWVIDVCMNAKEFIHILYYRLPSATVCRHWWRLIWSKSTRNQEQRLKRSKSLIHISENDSKIQSTKLSSSQCHHPGFQSDG